MGNVPYCWTLENAGFERELELEPEKTRETEREAAHLQCLEELAKLHAAT